MEPRDALQAAITQLHPGRGGQTQLAESINDEINSPDQFVTPDRVNKWLNTPLRMPFQVALAIQKLTHGAVSAGDLRPDLKDFSARLHEHRAVMNDRYEVGRQAMETPHESR